MNNFLIIGCFIGSLMASLSEYYERKNVLMAIFLFTSMFSWACIVFIKSLYFNFDNIFFILIFSISTICSIVYLIYRLKKIKKNKK
jgi:uncharacterized membrane protein YfcA